MNILICNINSNRTTIIMLCQSLVCVNVCASAALPKGPNGALIKKRLKTASISPEVSEQESKEPQKGDTGSRLRPGGSSGSSRPPLSGLEGRDGDQVGGRGWAGLQIVQ